MDKVCKGHTRAISVSVIINKFPVKGTTGQGSVRQQTRIKKHSVKDS